MGSNSTISDWNLCAGANNMINTSIFLPSSLVNAIENHTGYGCLFGLRDS